jgi:hypothetical protein
MIAGHYWYPPVHARLIAATLWLNSNRMVVPDNRLGPKKNVRFSSAQQAVQRINNG